MNLWISKLPLYMTHNAMELILFLFVFVCISFLLSESLKVRGHGSKVTQSDLKSGGDRSLPKKGIIFQIDFDIYTLGPF